MADRRDRGRDLSGRAFRPTLDGTLETRVLMAITHTNLPNPGFIQTAFGGGAVFVTSNTGQSFYISTTSGTVRAYNMAGGKVGLVLDGTTPASILTINPVVDNRVLNSGHTFNSRIVNYNGMLNIGAITVANGSISQILGYRTAVLSGPLIASGTTTVDRIAFSQILPGASINVGGTLNTLDVYNGINLRGPGTGIVVGLDLNSLTTNGDVDISGGAVISVGRDIGHTTQTAKGTGPANIGFTIAGNLVLFGGGKLAVGRYSVILPSQIPLNPITGSTASVVNTPSIIQSGAPDPGNYIPAINVTGDILGAGNITAKPLVVPPGVSVVNSQVFQFGKTVLPYQALGQTFP